MSRYRSSKKLKVLIIDDEWLIREELRSMLGVYENLEVIGEAENVDEAVTFIQNEAPDVIFLDIQMPGGSGFTLFDRMNISCNVVFVTAYDEYAIKAFDVNAVDYLLKPVIKSRLDVTIKRLIEGSPAGGSHEIKRMTIDDVLYTVVDNSYRFVKLKKIKCILAEGNYSFIVIQKDKKELVTKTLKEWQKILPEEEFIRIHRSAIVNVDSIVKIQHQKNRSNLVYIEGIPEALEMSRRYAMKLKTKL
ncbi:MAG: LytTR family DNA-binding domain-containing protein [candidate division KSB1 bacterium]|jgi:two-component system LytT family response regulator|nr:LytTR family DNA-binding domain-containing protein [candidate division KSB1 bacterium]